jgi:hypothetical protein
MPVDVVPRAEIEERQRMLSEHAAHMPPGRARQQVIAEIAVLRRLALLRRFSDALRKLSSLEPPSQPRRSRR